MDGSTRTSPVLCLLTNADFCVLLKEDFQKYSLSYEDGKMNLDLRATHYLINNFLKGNWLYGVLGRGAARLLRYELAKAGVDVFAIDWRIKSLPSVLDKLQRKCYKDLKDLNDRAGVRVICLYTHDIDIVLNHVSHLFHVQEMEDTIERGGPTTFGYSSKHCVLKWNEKYPGPAQFDDLPSYMRSFPSGEPINGEFKIKLETQIADANEMAKDVSFELQVRTLLQHAWASVSHELLYKQEHESSDKTHRRLARLAALLEEVDEVFALEAKEYDHSGSRVPRFLIFSPQPVTKQFLKQYSWDVLGLELPDKEAEGAIGYVSKLGIKTISDFEELMCSAIEALESATSFVLLRTMRSLWLYLNVIAYWANRAQPILPPVQQEVMDRYRHLVHEEHFQRVLRRLSTDQK